MNSYNIYLRNIMASLQYLAHNWLYIMELYNGFITLKEVAECIKGFIT